MRIKKPPLRRVRNEIFIEQIATPSEGDLGLLLTSVTKKRGIRYPPFYFIPLTSFQNLSILS